MEFIYYDADALFSVIRQFGIVFCNGFMIAVFLHFIAYGVFGVTALLNINK